MGKVDAWEGGGPIWQWHKWPWDDSALNPVSLICAWRPLHPIRTHGLWLGAR
jgi:hypothetical protein